MITQRKLMRLYLISPEIQSQKSRKSSGPPNRHKLQKLRTFDRLLLFQKAIQDRKGEIKKKTKQATN